MAFPDSALSVRAELDLAGTWTDVTSYTLVRSGYRISRGRSAEGRTANDSTCDLTLRNDDGRFSPRNATGPYYGLIGRNTLMRLSLPATSSYLQTTNTSGDGATAPDHTRLDITGDIDIRVDAWLPSWAASMDLIGKYVTTSNQRSWMLLLEDGGTLILYWTPDGTVASRIGVRSTASVPAPITGRKAVRATLDVNNGSGGNTVTFYYSDTIDGSWTQLGSAVVTAGTTSIYNSTSSLYLGDIAGLTGGYGTAYDIKRSRFYAARVLSGIGGTAAANPDFTTQADGTTSFADAAGNTWTVGGSAKIVGRNYRFHGEISEWPTRWDHSGRDVVVPATASGILRRLGRGGKALKSAYYRGCASTVAPVADLVAYWPCEDGAGASSIASGKSGVSAMGIAGTPNFASDSTSFPCSGALPTMGTASFSGNVPAYSGSGEIQVRFLMTIPSGGTTTNSVLCSIRCGGSVGTVNLVYQTGESLHLSFYNSTGTLISSTTPVSFSLSGLPMRVSVSLTQNGSDVDYSIGTLRVGQSSGTFDSGTLASQSVTTCRSVTLAATRNNADVTMGHVTVQSAVTGLFDLDELLNAYDGESVTDRLIRLCREEAIESLVMGDSPSATIMGPQTQQTLVDLLRECEEIDGGILFEPRDFFGIAYRSRESLGSQAASLTLDYGTRQVSWFEPTEDDQNITNDSTATRTGGSSARYVKTSGTLSTADPPSGVGTYDESVTVNAQNDTQLEDVASWRVHVGTVDEPRFPRIGLHLAHASFAGSVTLTDAATGLDVGDRLDVTNPPSWLPPADITQLAIGFSEYMTPNIWDLDYVCQPESPYHLGIYGGSGSRYSGDGTYVISADGPPVTTLIVTTPRGPVWSVADGSYDIMVSGSRFTVSAVGTPEILPNTGFESSTTDWWGNGGTLTRDTAVKRTGSASGKLVTGAGSDPRIESGGAGTYVITPGEVVTASAWLRADTARGLRLDINWFNSANTFISRSSSSVTTVTANVFTQFTLTAIAPAGAGRFDIAGVNNGTPGAGRDFYLDDATATTDRRQSLTVTLTNGVSKTISASSEVNLADPVYYA